MFCLILLLLHAYDRNTVENEVRQALREQEREQQLFRCYFDSEVYSIFQ